MSDRRDRRARPELEREALSRARADEPPNGAPAPRHERLVQNRPDRLDERVRDRLGRLRVDRKGVFAEREADGEPRDRGAAYPGEAVSYEPARRHARPAERLHGPAEGSRDPAPRRRDLRRSVHATRNAARAIRPPMASLI